MKEVAVVRIRQCVKASYWMSVAGLLLDLYLQIEILAQNNYNACMISM